MKTYIIDIETAPLPQNQIEAFQPEFKADTRLKDPIKIAEDIKNKKEKFIANAALNPLTSYICALGVWETSQKEPELYISNSEKNIIEAFLELIKEENLTRTRIVTFNGMNFDIPFLCRRGLLYGHDIFPTFYRIDGCFKILDKAPVFIDLAAIWDCRRKDYISLNDLAIYMGVGKKNKNEDLFYQLLEKNKDVAKDYLINDLKLTKDIAEKWGLIK
jgi:hypothetical protein